MKKTLCAMVFSCLMVVGLAGCGDDGDSTSDLMSKMCTKMDTCGYLKDSGMTVGQCKDLAKAVAGEEEPTAAEKDAAKACLEKSCEEFAACSGMAD